MIDIEQEDDKWLCILKSGDGESNNEHEEEERCKERQYTSGNAERSCDATVWQSWQNT